MEASTVKIVLIAVTILYIIAMVVLFLRFRRSMNRLAEKLRACREKNPNTLPSDAAQQDGDSEAPVIIHKRTKPTETNDS